MFDFNFLSAGDDYNLSGNEFRRMRLSAKGKISKNVSYAADFDFAGSKIAYRNVYLKLTAPDKLGSLMIGSFPEPTGLDMMTSSKYITFVERAMMYATQGGKYGAGFRYDNYNLADGKVGLQLAYTFNGGSNTAFKDVDLDGGANFIGRITGKILENKDSNQLVHLGLNYELRNSNTDSYGIGAFRTENHMAGGVAKYEPGSFGDTSNKFLNTNDIGFEAAVTFGSLSIQGEYELASIKTEDDTYKSSGYYGYVSYFLTGESRPHKNGAFGRVKPKSDFCLKDGNWGAVELVARYSVVDFNGYDVDDLSDDDIKIANITAGFNWYLNNNTRIMYNYISGDYNDIDPFGDKEKLAGHLLRFQIDF